MPWSNRRPVARRILARSRDPRIGSWSLPEVFELAHYYHAPDGSPSKKFQHRFCYMNYSPETFIFERSATVQGPAVHAASTDFAVLTIEARQVRHNPVELEESPIRASLEVQNVGQVRTEVRLIPPAAHRAALPALIELISVSDTSTLDACCS